MKRLIIILIAASLAFLSCEQKSEQKIEDPNQREMQELEKLKKDNEIEKLKIQREIDSLKQLRDSLNRVDSLTKSPPKRAK